jgi:hypothetical protein
MNYRDVVNAAYAGAIGCPCVSGIPYFLYITGK